MKRTGNEPRNWFGIQLGYDEIITSPASTDCCCYPLTDDQVDALLGLLEPLAWHTRWYSEAGDDIDPVKIEEFRNRIERILMSECCGDNGATTVVLTRVNPITFEIEVSVDGGVTWTPSPDSPQNLVVQLPPVTPVEGEDSKCNAAANLRQHSVDLVASHTSALGTATTVYDFIAAVAVAIAAFMFAPEAIPWIIPILASTGVALFGIGSAAWTAYWTSDEYDVIECAYFCNAETDGTLTDTGFAKFLAYIGTKMTAGIPRDMIYRDFQAMGRAGTQNLASYGGETGDCDDCTDCDIFPRLYPAFGVQTLVDMGESVEGHLWRWYCDEFGVITVQFAIPDTFDSSKCGNIKVSTDTTTGGWKHLGDCHIACGGSSSVDCSGSVIVAEEYPNVCRIQGLNNDFDTSHYVEFFVHF